MAVTVNTNSYNEQQKASFRREARMVLVNIQAQKDILSKGKNKAMFPIKEVNSGMESSSYIRDTINAEKTEAT